MKILALGTEKPGTPAEAFAPLLQAEASRVWELTQAGIIREIHFTRERDDMAVIVLECADAAAAAEVVGSLPLARAGLLTFEILTLTPYPGLQRLFASPFQG